MKTLNTLTLASTALLLAVAFASPPVSADAEQAEIKKAETVMVHECKKDFPEASKGKSLDELDQWAEASETAAGSVAFKKSHCFEAHEKWEKLAQKNEWAAQADGKRMPASPPKAPGSP